VTFRIVEDRGDPDRSETWKYLNGLLPHGGMFPMLPVQRERAVAGAAATVLRAVEGTNTIGAVFIGPSIEEANDALSNDANVMADRIARSSRSLHGIGVDSDRRSAGVGSELLKEAEARVAAEAETWLIIGVAHGGPALEEFYLRHGYTLGEPSRPMLLRAGSSVMVLQQSDPDARWFFKPVDRGTSGERAPIRALHPSDHQLEMIRAGADKTVGHRY